MRQLLLATLLVSTGALAEEAAKVEEAEEATIANHKEWPSLDELWNGTETGQGVQKTIAGGTPSAELLLGYEYSDLSGNGADEAHALVSRIRLNYLTGQYKGFDGFVQAQHVGPINQHYAPEDPGYDPVPDPENFRFHQAYLGYSGYDTVARFGAQEINLDNERFIGNVGWRLNAQSFNAAMAQNNSITNLTLFYAYADSINGIDGEINHDRQYHLLNAEFNGLECSKFSGFAYLQRNDDAPLDKLDTFGLRAWGKNERISHDAMVAFQRHALYGLLQGDLNLAPASLGAGVEYLSGGDDLNERFQTLNGTTHKFNGWADQFTGTNGGLPGGLIDFWGQAALMATEKLQLMLAVHYFNTANDTPSGTFSGMYGHEIDAMAKYPVCKNFDVLAKFAHYVKGEDDAGNFTSDENVFWLRGTLRF